MSYFPLLILLVDKNEEMVVKTPGEIPSGVTFKVLNRDAAKITDEAFVKLPAVKND